MIISNTLSREDIMDIIYPIANMQNLGLVEAGNWVGKSLGRLNAGDCDVGNVFKILTQLPENNSGLMMTFSAPKTVSIMALVADDKRIFDAHDHSIATVLSYMEKYSAQTLLQGGEEGVSVVHTGELAMVTYRGYTEESGDERKPLPNLHTSCLLFNLTFADNKPMGIHTLELYKQKHLFEQIYQNELGNKLASLDYATRWNDNGDICTLEIKGVPDDIIRAFSKH